MRILWTPLSYLVLLLGLPEFLPAEPPKQQQVEVKASDTAQLQRVLEHRNVEGMFVDGTYLKGRVEEVTEQGVRVQVQDSTGPSALIAGLHTLRVSRFSTIKLTRYKGRKSFVLAALFGSVATAAAVLFLLERDEAAGPGSEAAAAMMSIGGIAGGYFWGRQRERREITIVIR